MADGEVKVKFGSEGADALSNNVAKISAQFSQLSNVAKKIGSINIGCSGGGSVSFTKETWTELHRSLAGVEEASMATKAAVEALGASMRTSASSGTRANTLAIKAQTAAMKDLANTNAMLHEVLIGEAPLNVQIATTRRGITAATQAATTATRGYAVATTASNASMRASAGAVAQARRGFSSVAHVAGLVSPQLMIVSTGAASVARAFSAIKTPAGLAGAAVGLAAVAAGAVFLKGKLDALKSTIDSMKEGLSKNISAAVRGATREANVAIERLQKEREIMNLKTSDEAFDAWEKHGETQEELLAKFNANENALKALANQANETKKALADYEAHGSFTKLGVELASKLAGAEDPSEVLKNHLKEIDEEVATLKESQIDLRRSLELTGIQIGRTLEAAARLAKEEESMRAASADYAVNVGFAQALEESNEKFRRAQEQAAKPLKTRVSDALAEMKYIRDLAAQYIEDMSEEDLKYWTDQFNGALREYESARDALAKETAKSSEQTRKLTEGLYADALTRVGGYTNPSTQSPNGGAVASADLSIARNTASTAETLKRILNIIGSASLAATYS